MHLLIIITDYGSFNNFLSELAVQLVTENNKVSVICSKEKVINFDDRFDYASLGIDIHFVNFPRGFNLFKQLKASKQINNLVRQINPDIIHAHFTTGIFTAVLYQKLPKLTIGTIHGLGFPVLTGLKKYIFKLIEYFCIGRLDQVWLLNRSDYEIVSKINDEKAFILDVAGLGCDISRFDSKKFESKRSTIKSDLGINEKSFVIAFTGRFVHFKGFDLVIRAFLELNKSDPSNYTLILIGGPDSIHKTGLTESEEREYLDCNQIIKAGFTQNVEYYLSIADIFLFPSLKEGMPICIIEALAMGVPTITADSRGCNDLVVNSKNGILLSATPTVEEIIEALTFLKENPLVLKEFKENALKRRVSLSRDLYIERQIDVYSNLAKP